MPKPRGLFISGSDTDVGKTYIACQIARYISGQGINVTPRKPVESGCNAINNELYPADADQLLQASGSELKLSEVCRFRFAPAISPQLAARSASKKISLNELHCACLNNLGDKDFLLVEGAGGFLSPIAEKLLNADLARALQLSVLIVVSNRLGAVNQALLTIKAVESYGLSIAGIILNTTRPDPLHKLIDNASEIKQFASYPVIINHYQSALDTEHLAQLISRA